MQKKSSGSSLGQQRQNHFSKNNNTGPPQPPEKPNSRTSYRSELPIQDPPWWKNETQIDNNERLSKSYTLPPTRDPPLPPTRDPPQVKKKSPYGFVDGDRFNKPCPLPPSQPTQDWRRKSSSDQIDNESRINKPLPMTPQHSPRLKKKSPYAQLDEDRLNKPCPLPPSHDTGWPKRRTSSDETDIDSRINKKALPKTPPQKISKTWERKFTPHDASPPPPLPERGSSKKDLFDNTPPKVAKVGKKSQPPPPPMKPKSPQPIPQDYDSDDDFPTADQFKKSQAFTNPSTHSSRPPSVPPKSSYRDPIDDRPPLPPPKHSTGYRYR